MNLFHLDQRAGCHDEPSGRRRLGRNLEIWAELTGLCIELRKAALRRRDLDDAEADRRVWADIRRAKEDAWLDQTF